MVEAGSQLGPPESEPREEGSDDVEVCCAYFVSLITVVWFKSTVTTPTGPSIFGGSRFLVAVLNTHRSDIGALLQTQPGTLSKSQKKKQKKKAAAERKNAAGEEEGDEGKHEQ
jgi:hypothetical protein